MANQIQVKQLREAIRQMERKLGVLKEYQTACCNISLAQCHALVEIGRANSISLIELSELLSLDNSTMSRTVNNLVNQGLAERELDKNDRRYISIKLTRSGTEVFQDIEERMNLYYEHVFQSIPTDKQEQVLESLQLLLNAMDK